MSDTANPARTRAEIDSGQTGDKVAVSDPAASPLGTDSEAAGTPAGTAEGHEQRGLEGQKRAAEKTDPSRTRSATADPMGLPILIAAAAAVVLGLGYYLLLA